jgi:hypothetical protein
MAASIWADARLANSVPVFASGQRGWKKCLRHVHPEPQPRYPPRGGKYGTCQGRKAFGFTPGEAETLKRMKELSASGISATDIAATLRAARRKTRNGGEWLQPTSGQILNRDERWSG